MCRRNQLLSIALLAFGLGLLIGCWMESVFARNCLGLGLIAAGIILLQKK